MKRLHLLAASLVFATGVARADAVDECTDAAQAGQVALDGGKLLDARRRFGACASATCPDLVRRDCASWLASVEDRLPSVVVKVRDASGIDVVDAAVTLDGAPIPLDGKSVAVDPGRHVFVAVSGDRKRELTVLVVEREHSRAVELGFDPAPAPALPAPPSRAQSYVGYGLLGLGGAALVTSAVLFAVGYSQWSTLRDCRPSCVAADADAAHRMFVATDVVGAVGLVAIGVGIVLLVTAPKANPSAAGLPFALAF